MTKGQNVNFLETLVHIYQDHEIDVDQWGDNLVGLCTPCYSKRYAAGCDVTWHSEGDVHQICVDCGCNSDGDIL